MAGTAPYRLTPQQQQIINDREDAPLGLERFQNIVDEAISDAERYRDDDLAPDREQAWRYYMGEPMGTEIKGRSQIVMTEVRDVVHTVIPGLMRVFTGSEHVVEFAPVEENDVEMAKMATDYVDHIFTKDNPGFQTIYQLAMDGLIKKCGILKWWYEKKAQVLEERYEGLTMEQAAQLRMEPGVVVIAEELVQPGQKMGAY